MPRWYFWVLAPILVGVGMFFLRTAHPSSVSGNIILYVLTGVLFLSALGLFDPIRFRWAFRLVALAIVVSGLACLGDPSAREAAGPFLWSLSIPALIFLFSGRSRTIVDTIVAPEPDEVPRE